MESSSHSDASKFHKAIWKDDAPQMFTSVTVKNYRPSYIVRIHDSYNDNDLSAIIRKAQNYVKDHGKSIEEIILVGDSSKTLRLSRMIPDFFGGKQLSFYVGTDAVCAIGTSLLAFCAETSAHEEDMGDTEIIRRQWKQLEAEKNARRKAEIAKQNQEEKIQKPEKFQPQEAVLKQMKKEFQTCFDTAKLKQTGAELTPRASNEFKMKPDENQENMVAKLLLELVRDMQKEVVKQNYLHIVLHKEVNHSRLEKAHLKMAVLEKFKKYLKAKVGEGLDEEAEAEKNSKHGKVHEAKKEDLQDPKNAQQSAETKKAFMEILETEMEVHKQSHEYVNNSAEIRAKILEAHKAKVKADEELERLLATLEHAKNSKEVSHRETEAEIEAERRKAEEIAKRVKSKEEDLIKCQVQNELDVKSKIAEERLQGNADLKKKAQAKFRDPDADEKLQHEAMIKAREEEQKKQMQDAYEKAKFWDFMSKQQAVRDNEAAALACQQAEYCDFYSQQEAEKVNEAVARALYEEELYEANMVKDVISF